MSKLKIEKVGVELPGTATSVDGVGSVQAFRFAFAVRFLEKSWRFYHR